MATDYERLRADLAAELEEPGAVTKAEVRALLDKHPIPDDFADGDFDPNDFG